MSSPSFTVVISAYNEERFVADAIRSVLAQTREDFELVVVDDGSTDATREIADRWLREHEDVPAVLAGHPANRGLPTARNTALGLARGRYVLIVDADNELYPNCVERLLSALEQDPDAAFAYGILEKFDDRGSRGLLGVGGWDPARLRVMNYIDALALIRRSALEEVGGFETDIRLYGWEDYDLWCKFAERGMRAAHVREIVARYRVSPGSMINLTDLDQETPLALLRERHPRLFAGEPRRRRGLPWLSG
jgi:glycosyltransferase involved in cell wall biosynthesis